MSIGKSVRTLLSLTPLLALAACDRPVDENVISDGIRYGTVTKFSFKGQTQLDAGSKDGTATDAQRRDSRCFNWTGELGMANSKMSSSMTMVQGSGSSEASGGDTFEFSVNNDDKELIAKIQEAAKTGERIGIGYKQIVRHDPCKARSDYTVVSVEKVPAITVQSCKAIPGAEMAVPGGRAFMAMCFDKN